MIKYFKKAWQPTNKSLRIVGIEIKRRASSQLIAAQEKIRNFTKL